jgi:hypothetical protein
VITAGSQNVTDVDFGVTLNLPFLAMQLHGTGSAAGASPALGSTGANNLIVQVLSPANGAKNTATVSLPPGQSAVRQITVTGTTASTPAAKTMLAGLSTTRSRTGDAGAEQLINDLSGANSDQLSANL